MVGPSLRFSSLRDSADTYPLRREEVHRSDALKTTRRCDEKHRSTEIQCSDVQSAATISSLLIVSRSDLRRCDLHIRVAAYLQRHEYVLIASLR